MDLQQGSFIRKVKALDVILLLFFIFAVKFIFLPLNTSRLVVVGCLFFLFFLSKEKLRFEYHIGTFYCLLPLMLYGVYTSIVTLVSGGDNLANLLNIILILSQIPIGAYLLSIFFIKVDMDQLLFTLLIVFGVQGALVFLNFLWPQYREIMYVLMPVEGNITEDNFTSAFRTRGLMQSSGASVSALLAFGFLIGVYFLTSFDLSKLDRRWVLLCMLFVLIGIAFTGRTGIIMVPIALFAYYALLIINKRFKFKKLLILLYIPLVSIVIYFVVKEFFGVLYPSDAQLFDRWEKWAITGFLANFDSSGNTSTLEVLESYLFLPEEDNALLFGDPNTWGVVRTDVGYIRMIFSVGLIGAILFYTGILTIYSHLIWTSKTLAQKMFFLFCVMWLFILEYKEPMNANYYFVAFGLVCLFFNMKSQPSESEKK